MALILNIETSTEVCSVVLSKDGKTVVEKESSSGLKHSELLTVFIEDILKHNHFDKSDLDAVAVSKGPGSYTGLRIGVSAAKGLCYGLDIPLISVSTLDAFANYVVNNQKDFIGEDDVADAFICPMLDARRMEVYTALYDFNNQKIEDVHAKIIESDSFANQLNKGKIIFVGNATVKVKDIITHKNAIFTQLSKASARFMQNLSEKAYCNKNFEDVAYFEPFYLKDFIATKPKNNILNR